MLGLSFSGFSFLGSEVTQNQHFPAETELVFDKTPAAPLPSSSHPLCVSSLALVRFLLGKLNATSSLLTKSAVPGSVTTSGDKCPSLGQSLLSAHTFNPAAPVLRVCEELRAVGVLGSPPLEMCSHNSHFSVCLLGFFCYSYILYSVNQSCELLRV